jgi:2'-5' RNA ligase
MSSEGENLLQPDKSSRQEPELRRLFFAWWPAPHVQMQLHQLAAMSQPNPHARITQQDKIHLTLAFLGAVDQAFVDCAVSAASAVRWQPFSLLFDRLGWFPRARVMWVGCSRPHPQIGGMVAALSEALQSCGFVPEHRRFQPHLTIARKVNRPPKVIEIEPVECRVDQFSLVESILDSNGARYNILEQFEATESET